MAPADHAGAIFMPSRVRTRIFEFAGGSSGVRPPAQFCFSFAGFFLGSPLGRLRTIHYSNVHWTFSFTWMPSRVRTPDLCKKEEKMV